MEHLNAILGKMTSMVPGSDFSLEKWEQMKVDSFNTTPGERHLEDGHNCPICRNKGVVMRLDTSDGWPRGVFGDCKCVPVRNAILRMHRSGLKDIIRDYTFARYEATEPWQQAVKQAAVEYAKDPKGWFFIGGQTGAGKTHVCTAVCRELLLGGKNVLYMLWRDEIVPLKGMVTESAEYTAAVEKYKNAEILYIDDLFKTGKGQDPTSGDVNVAFEILNHRYNAKMPTIISSECTTSALLDIDEAVAGRILERAKVLNLGRDREKNYRLKRSMDL